MLAGHQARLKSAQSAGYEEATQTTISSALSILLVSSLSSSMQSRLLLRESDRSWSSSMQTNNTRMESFTSSQTDTWRKSLMGSARNPLQSQQSSRKRARYVLHACERCKRQKIRCNGEQPCDKCQVKRPKECSYGQWLHIDGDQRQPPFDTAGGNNHLKDGDEDIANGVGLLAAW